jgi:hypothetical protein
MLLEGGLSHDFLILLLGRLNPHHLQLKHLHLDLGLGRGKGRGEGDAIWVHRLMLNDIILVEYMVVLLLK